MDMVVISEASKRTRQHSEEHRRVWVSVCTEREVQRPTRAGTFLTEDTRLHTVVTGERGSAPGAYFIMVHTHLNDREPSMLWPLPPKPRARLVPAALDADAAFGGGRLDEFDDARLTLDEQTIVVPHWKPHRTIELAREGACASTHLLTLATSDESRHDLWVRVLLGICRRGEAGTLTGTAIEMGGASRVLRPPEAGEPEVDVLEMKEALATLEENLRVFKALPDNRVELNELCQRISANEGLEEAPVLRRLTIVFLQLTAERAPNGQGYVAKVPRMVEHSTRWRQYTTDYVRWMHALVNSQMAPVAVDGYPQSEIVRVRTIFLCCDLTMALHEYLKSLRQDRKVERLHDLVRAMVQWAKTMETQGQAQDPTQALFSKFLYPPENRVHVANTATSAGAAVRRTQLAQARDVAAFLETPRFRPHKLQSFLEVGTTCPPLPVP